MEPIETFKSFALISFISSILVGSYMVWKGPRDKTKSVSFHAATANKKLYILYAFVFLTATVFFYLFCMLWFIPMFALSFGFTFSLHLMTILLILSALIPEAGKKTKAHAIVAYGFALCMMFLLIFIGISQNVSLTARAFCGFNAGWMALGWYLFFFSPYKQIVVTYYLPYQYSYIILFCLSIVAATYIK